MPDISFTALTPLAFLGRAAEVFADKTAIVYGERRSTYREFAAEATRLARALPALDPRVVVLAGRSISLDALGRLVYSVRSVAQQAVIFDYRGAVPDTGASTVRRLGQTPLAARDLLIAALEANHVRRAPSASVPVSAITAR
ncbi:MAG: hypothetical protein ACTHMY_02670 [Solirubrobacteraceae bacterium]